MRFSICLLALVALANASVYIPTTLQKVLTLKDLWFGPKIPQIIFDTDHPWLADNKEWLSRYPDVRTAICLKDSDLWTKPTIPSRALPKDLLAIVNIDNNKQGRTNFGWKNAGDRLRELKACPAALEDGKDLHLNVWIHGFQYDTWSEDPMPPSELPDLFAEVLSKMPNLETLHWSAQSEFTNSLKDALAKANVTLSSVKNLFPGGHHGWLVRRCPNLEKISIPYVNSLDPDWRKGDDLELRYHHSSSIALINATKGLPLQSIHMVARPYLPTRWMDLLEAILDAQPNITDIGMDRPNEMWPGPESDNDPEKLKQQLELLARFPHLTSLNLPSVSQLNLGFDGGHWCGNAYGGAHGREYGRQVVQEGAETAELAGNMTIEVLPHLTRLSIGGRAPEIFLNEEGKAELVWPWTRRMKEYTYELWPEIEDYFDGTDE
ncbi:uncharacterized protein N0V89_009023 [Didymosphaeria variabile]|uniref:Uncharacterized protein n=1 Tax=Didymosphaeria variabile TaxID=1932322 RepID=A0A9W8XIQ3_9PLEO|nr:uncharacterized protein N0V89_009023 [Didymosphaeria variabile]KAJ4350402.1 hypothetical protein N0V89_009023 [Didymosphaeria variabile]